MSAFDDAREISRAVRRAYDRLGAGPIGILKRCRSRAELQEEGWFWKLLADADAQGEARRLAPLIVCFPTAPSLSEPNDRFDLGAHLRRRIYRKVGLPDLPRRAVPFRRLLAARDRDDLAHQLRRLLLRASQPRDGGARVDWGVIGVGVMFFGDGVRRQWATGFYTTDHAMDDGTIREEML